jgi:tRNA pseudouridine55 synthase
MHDGLVLLDKPAGRTSFEALSPVKRALGTGKVGHAGTLDRFATGLLLVLTGKLTRLIRVFADTEKRYTARIRFGVETSTLDPEGERTAEGEIPSGERLTEVLGRFIGELQQVPPAYSAVHVDGQRAYQKVRAGRTISLTPRPVSVHSIELVRFEPPEAVVDVRCGSGTYVRSLARDIAYELGTVAHLSGLRRTAIGEFGVDEAVSPDDFQPDRDLEPARLFADRVGGVSRATLRRQSEKRVRNGAPLSEEDFSDGASHDGVVLVMDRDGEVLAAAEKQGRAFKYLFVSAG